jgi:AraC-like DNA-binding protein
MNYREFPPPAQLQHSVRCFWTLEEEHTPHTEEHLFFPERSVRLIFYHGESYVGLPNGMLTALPQTSFLMGFQNGPLRAVSKGFTRVLGVELYPWSAMRLLDLAGVQAMHFMKVGVALERLNRQIAALLRSDAPQEALELLEDWLTFRSKEVNLESNVAIEAAKTLYTSFGQGKIGDIAEELGVSTRQLERGFLHSVGISAKQLARTIRFEEAHNRLLLEPDRSLTELALELGYADQAHFNREFRAFTQMNPTAFVQYMRIQHQPDPFSLEELAGLFKRSSGVRF